MILIIISLTVFACKEKFGFTRTDDLYYLLSRLCLQDQVFLL